MGKSPGVLVEGERKGEVGDLCHLNLHLANQAQSDQSRFEWQLDA